MSLPPVLLSEIILQHPEVVSFEELLHVIRRHGEEGGSIFMEFDINPEFPDTPRNWESRVESAFVGGAR